MSESQSESSVNEVSVGDLFYVEISHNMTTHSDYISKTCQTYTITNVYEGIEVRGYRLGENRNTGYTTDYDTGSERFFLNTLTNEWTIDSDVRNPEYIYKITVFPQPPKKVKEFIWMVIFYPRNIATTINSRDSFVSTSTRTFSTREDACEYLTVMSEIIDSGNDNDIQESFSENPIIFSFLRSQRNEHICRDLNGFRSSIKNCNVYPMESILNDSHIEMKRIPFYNQMIKSARKS